MKRRIWPALLTATILLGTAAGAQAQGVFTPTMSLFQQVYSTLTQDYVTAPNPGTLLRGAIDGMIATLQDPYTAYYDPTQAQQLFGELGGQFVGIGIELSQVGPYIVVQAVFPGTPAAKAGLETGDRILAAGKTKLVGASTSQAVAAIGGPAGSTVALSIGRSGRTLTITATREAITLPPVLSRMLPGGIAYIELLQVTPNSASAFDAALSKLQAAHPRGYILDLRNDPGGDVGQIVAIAQRMIPSGTIVRFSGRVYNQVYTSSSGQSLGAPLAVLVNGGTASAAEILAGALEDHHVGTLVGSQTFGKGVAQEIIPMQAGGVVKITVARWYTPNGTWVEHVGLKPQQYAGGDKPALYLAMRLLGVTMPTSIVLHLGHYAAEVDGEAVTMDSKPVQQSSQVYVTPYASREVFGAVATVSPGTSTVALHFGQHTLVAPYGDPYGMLDGHSVAVTPVRLVQGQPLVPVRDLMLLEGLTLQTRAGVLTFSLQ